LEVLSWLLIISMPVYHSVEFGLGFREATEAEESLGAIEAGFLFERGLGAEGDGLVEEGEGGGGLACEEEGEGGEVAGDGGRVGKGGEGSGSGGVLAGGVEGHGSIKGG